MLVQAVLGGLIIVGGHHQDGIRAYFAGIFGIVQHMVGIVGAGAGDDGDPLCDLFHGEADDLLLVGIFNGGIFAGGAYDHDGIDAVFNLEFNKPTQGIKINAVPGHGGDNGSSHAGKDGVFHYCQSPSWISGKSVGWGLAPNVKFSG